MDKKLDASEAANNLDKTLVEKGVDYAKFHLSKEYMERLSSYPVVSLPMNADLAEAQKDFRLFEVEKIVYEKDENTIDKLASIYGALYSLQSSIILIIDSTKDGLKFYIGTKKIIDDNISANTLGDILTRSFNSNFMGSSIKSIDINTQERLLKKINNKEKSSVTSVAVNPSLRNKENKNFVQGFEKFLDGFTGIDYTAVFLAIPQSKSNIDLTKRGLEQLYSTLSPFLETTLQYGTSEQKSVTDSLGRSFSSAINRGITDTNGGNTGFTRSRNDGYSTNESSGFGMMGYNSSHGAGTFSASGWSDTSGSNWSLASTEGTTKTDGDNESRAIQKSTGITNNITVKHTDKTIKDMLDIIDERLEQLDKHESYGMWQAGAYFISDIQTSVSIGNAFRALVLGDETKLDAYVNTWGESGTNSNDLNNLFGYISRGMHPQIMLPEYGQYRHCNVSPAAFVSGKELPIIMGFPRQSLKGIVVDSMASFGRTVSLYNKKKDENTIRIGVVSHKGVKENDNIVNLDIDELTKHCFVTGATGSGKSNTVYQLVDSLHQKGKNFLIIEPAKGEYKNHFGRLDGINVFWTQKDYYSFLRINPFSFPNEIHILEHLDRLIEIFSACWPLHNSMPAILKDSIERAYIEKGWDITNSIHFDIGKSKFPNFMDLKESLEKVINASGYGKELLSDLKGALGTRVSSLTNGIVGEVFSSGQEVDDRILFDENTIIDLSRVGASETKSLIMGIIVLKLNEYRISQRVRGIVSVSDNQLRHITVIEEAHNLLRRTSTAQSADSANVAGKSVEMISNSIAEMRTFGEGFIIVDQSPTTVDTTAIKNTNTKIVMNLPAIEDVEAVGGAFSLSPEQMQEIPKLPMGLAIIKQSTWIEAVKTAIDKCRDEYKYEGNMKPQKNERKQIIVPFIKMVFEMADQAFAASDRQLVELFKKYNISASLQKELRCFYKSFSHESIKCSPKVCDSKSKAKELLLRANFVANIMGIKGILDTFPFNAKKIKDTNTVHKMFVEEWEPVILDVIDTYAEFDSISDKRKYALMHLVVLGKNGKYKECWEAF